MRKRFFRLVIIVWVSCFSLRSIAQSQRKIDSLFTLLSNVKQDTDRVRIMTQLCLSYALVGDYESSKTQATKLKTLCEQVLSTSKDSTVYKRTELGLIDYYLYSGFINRVQGDFELATRNLTEALAISEKIKSKKLTGSSLVQLGIIHNIQAKYSEALSYFLRAKKLAEETGDKRSMGDVCMSIGSAYSELGNFPEAVQNYFTALKNFEEIGYKQGTGSCYNNLGEVFNEQNHLAEAAKSYGEAIKIWRELGNKKELANTYVNVGAVYQKQGNLPEAMNNYSAAMEIVKEIGDPYTEGLVLTNLASVYALQTNYTEAEKNYLAAIKLMEQMESDRLAMIYGNIGGVYTQMKNFPNAELYFDKAVSRAKQTGGNDDLKDIYLGYSEMYLKKNDYKKAYEYYELYSTLKDSILNEDNNKQILEIKGKYESEKKDKEIIQLESDKQRLESDQKINSLMLEAKRDSLSISEAENEKVRLENEKIQALNLVNQQSIKLLGNEKQLQQLQIQKDQADYGVQKAETDKKEEQLLVLSKEKTIQGLDLKKQKQAKNYFIAGLLLLALLSLLAYTNYRTKKQLELQSLRNKIAHDLHDDIGSTLNSISIYSEVAQIKSREKIAELELIGESSRKVMDAMSDIVWTINPDNDSFEKIIFRMRSLTHLLMKAKNLEYTFKADEKLNQLELPMQTRKNFYLIFKEALNNLLKYSNATRAAIAMNYANDNIELSIRDNGVGFDTNNPPRGNGLNSMRQRAEKIKAKFNIQSSLGNGTSVELYLKT